MKGENNFNIEALKEGNIEFTIAKVKHLNTLGSQKIHNPPWFMRPNSLEFARNVLNRK
jgi:predicted RNA methylase